MEVDHVERQDSAWVVYFSLPEISEWMEDRARSHVGSGVISYCRRAYSPRFARTWTRVPSGSLPFRSSTTPLRITPSNSFGAGFVLQSRVPGVGARATPPLPLSMASLASPSASLVLFRGTGPILNPFT